MVLHQIFSGEGGHPVRDEIMNHTESKVLEREWKRDLRTMKRGSTRSKIIEKIGTKCLKMVK